MAIFKSLTFDGINSLDYGIYITGEAVYNAPERAVEMINIPGKNGALALDQGRFENIEVTYHAGCFADSQADFADKVMRFRNALASRYTYKRLTDEYHPDEYRLGLYKSGLDVDAVRYGTAGEFNIVFDCKPQRFLIDGDRAISPTEWSDLQTESGELVTIESDGSLAVKSLEVSLEPIQAGSGEPSPSNVRAISGHTECVTSLSPYEQTERHTITGKNLYNAPNNQNGVLVPCHIENGVSVVASCSSSGAGVRYYNSAQTQIDYWTLTLQTNGRYYRSFTASGGIEYVEFYGSQSTNYMIEVGASTPSDYEPYGNSHTTTLGRTVYGGTLDVVSGVLTVTHGFVDLGTLTWTRLTNANKTYFQTVNEVADMKKSSGNGTIQPIICSNYQTETWTHTLDSVGYDGCICEGWRERSYICIYDEAKAEMTANEFKTAMSGVQLCYELATPQTYQLTPQQVELLLGENHVWSDGEITVEYGTLPYYNPTQFESKPLLVVTGKGVLQIGDYVLTIGGTETQTLYIDCDSQEAWEVVGAGRISRNDYIQNAGEEFPVLVPGINNISLGSGITAVTITPRWWRI